MNYMIHNLLAEPTRVSLTYDIDFIPDGTATAKKLTGAHPLWMDVAGLAAYPVFDVHKGQGKRGKFTFPDQARPSQQKDIGGAREYTATRDMTILQTAGHLHPGGLYTDLKLTRGRTHQGAVQVRGQVLRAGRSGVVGRVDDGHQAELASGGQGRRPPEHLGHVRHAEGVLVRVDGDHGPVRCRRQAAGGQGPVQGQASQGGAAHPRAPAREPQSRRKRAGEAEGRTGDADGAFSSNLTIKGFIYERGDFSSSGKRGRPPVVRAGKSITFTNLDATRPSPTRTRLTTRSRRARRPVPARRVSPTRWPTATCSSTRASSDTARPDSLRRPTATPGRRRRA